MPYIKQAVRKAVDGKIDALAEAISLAPFTTEPDGVVNYAITRLVQKTMLHQGVTYGELERCVGLLECCKAELYRKGVAPYEDEKAAQNGEVY